MLYHILSYDSSTFVARAIEASLYAGQNTPSGQVVSVKSNINLEEGRVYTFYQKDFFEGNPFIRAELDYDSPNPLGGSCARDFN